MGPLEEVVDVFQLDCGASSPRSPGARVFYTGPDGAGSLVVDDRGKPFRVTTERASNGYWGEPVGNLPVTREHAWDKNGVSSRPQREQP